jgi:biopolymer transport protein ExbB/TolQ
MLHALTMEIPDRRKIMVLAAGAAGAFVAVMTVILTRDSRPAQLLLDFSKFSHFPYPFTIQNLEHILFFIALGELFVRWRVASREHGFLNMSLLPEDDHTVLQAQDLSPIRRKVAPHVQSEHGILPSLIDICILQFQSGRSIDQTVAVMNSQLELIEHRVDLRYGLVRFIAWLVPTLGFIGTVIGLGASLALVPESGEIKLYDVAHALSLGFDCTMIALAQSAILVFVLHLVQEKEETAVNLAGTYTLRNLVNRLYEGQK